MELLRGNGPGVKGGRPVLHRILLSDRLIRDIAALRRKSRAVDMAKTIAIAEIKENSSRTAGGPR